MQEQHTCEAIVLRCIDFRFRKTLSEYLISKFPGEYDLMAIPGGVKLLLSGGRDEDFVLKQIGLSLKFHSPKIIVLVQHEDCAGYGGSKVFDDSKAEQKFQEGQLKEASQLLLKNFPGVKVETYFAKLSKEVIEV